MPQFSTTIADLIARLTYHTKSGQTPKRLLDGFRFEAVPTAEVEGLKDLPGIRIYIPDVGGNYRPTRSEEGTIKFRLIVATKRTAGLVEHLKAVELVMDALNMNAGTPAAVTPVPGTSKPFEWSTGENFVDSNALNSQISISLEPKVVELGRRRL